jgi:hypothetical protein
VVSSLLDEELKDDFAADTRELYAVNLHFVPFCGNHGILYFILRRLLWYSKMR